MYVELELSQRQSEADQLRLWNDLSTRILSLHSRRPYVAMSSAANNSADLHDPAAKQRSHHLTEGQLAGVNTVGLSSASRLHRSYSSQQSSPVDVYSTVSRAGRFGCFLTLLLPQTVVLAMLKCN